LLVATIEAEVAGYVDERAHVTDEAGRRLVVRNGHLPERSLQTPIGGLSATTITRLKACWSDEYKQWAASDLSDKHYVYIWADGIHFNIRLEDEGANKQCILVLIGATAEGKKELIAITDGYRESKQSWYELLLSVKDRGLKVDPKLAIGDGALGFWAAAREIFPGIDEQRPRGCWVHKTANVLNKLPKSSQPKAKSMLHNI
jgi:transposase-like protein